MQPTICSRCNKNVAVIFITKIENGETKNEGLCLKCARELHIKPIDDVINKMGINEDELESIMGEMTSLTNPDELIPSDDDASDDDTEGKTATFPFISRLFGNIGPNQESFPKNEKSKKADSADDKKKNNKKFLSNYCIDVSAKAKAGKLDAMIGREEELERVIQILNRRQKNNPCLIGEPGVGKTAIAEGLAQRISDGNVPYKLRDKQVYMLDLTALVAGTQFRGQFESRMKGLIDEVRKLGNIILVIDEVHSIVGAGDAEGSMNAANILKPALSRGEIQVIGATTFAEYRKHIEKDSALERRFQPVTVNEPSIAESIRILKGIAHYYEEYHCVEISEKMCERAVVLSERYITDRFLPDKAIDLIDEACSDVNLKDEGLNKKMLAEHDLDNIRFEREALASDTSTVLDDEQLDKRYARIAELRSKEMQLEREIAELSAVKPKLTEENLARIIELWTKIPASSIKEDEFERIANLDTRLKNHIIGQDKAVDAVCAAITRNRVGLQVKRKPVSFIFVGGTGVGKTEFVKRLAEDMFDSPESLIRLDMSEYMEKFAVSRLIGSPPGYVGYEEAGQLTEKVRRKPYCVVLFDEIEKAHPDVMNILLQVLDDGRITDAQGRTVNFENTVIIMTTNAGSGSKSASLGFGSTISDMTKDRAMKALGEFLRPEFINRVDEIICFNQLTEDNFRAIAKIMLNEVKTVLTEKHIELFWTDSVIDYLVKEAYSVTYGARNLRRVIQKQIEDMLAQRIIEYRNEEIHTITIDSENGSINAIIV